jgi:hypothetical protein
MAGSGPIPKRDAERTRRNKPENEGGVSLAKGIAYPVNVPPADPTWAPRAKTWYDSLATSGMAEFMQNSDFEYARILCDALTHYYDRPSAMMLASILSGMTSLGTTEGDRRRMRIELEAPKPEIQSVGVTALAGYKSKLGAKK